jgi:hypothetical protein
VVLPQEAARQSLPPDRLDLPGLGLSGRPDNNDYSVDKMARDLDAVVALAGMRPWSCSGTASAG